MKQGKTTISGTFSRRRLLRTGAAAAGLAAGSGAITGFPTIWAQNIKNVTLRQFGTGVSNLNAIAEKCKADLGITLQMTALDSDAVTQRAVTQPKSYDIADIEYWICKKVFPTGVLQPMDTQKLKYFDKIVPIFTTGKLTPTSTIAQGTAPHTVGFVDGKESKVFAKGYQTAWLTMVPTIYNADTLGIRPDLVGRPIKNWKDIMDPKFKGKTSILNIPSIGIMDAAMICESMGVMKYGDKGNMTKAEIDGTMKVLTEAKKAGQFRAFWKTFDESVNLMASGEVIIQSMWSPAVTAVRSKGIPCIYQPLEEGYRAWGGGLALAKHLTGLQLDAAYEYINWYMSGWVGAYLNRQGYYSAVLDTAKQHMSEDEWGFWMEGKPAKADIKNPDGKIMEKAGAVRDGGSFYDRMGKVACWNAVMDEDRYMVRKWNEFIAAERRDGAEAAAGTRRGRRPGHAMTRRSPVLPYLLATPLGATFAFFLILPIAAIVMVSFWDYDSTQIYPDFIATNYVEVLTSQVTWKTYLNTLRFTAIVWLLTLAIGFTVAYFLAFCVQSFAWQMALFLLCTIPFWTSNIIRMISWIPFLGRNGLLNGALLRLGAIDRPLEFLLFSDFAVVLALVHLYTLFMVVPIFNSMMRIDRSLLEAAHDAGAGAWQTVANVVLPLCKPGIAIGSIFIVTLVMGDFITVRLMSGGQSASVGLMIANQISLLQYPAAAANAVVLLAVVLLMVAAMLRIVDIRKQL